MSRVLLPNLTDYLVVSALEHLYLSMHWSKMALRCQDRDTQLIQSISLTVFNIRISDRPQHSYQVNCEDSSPGSERKSKILSSSCSPCWYEVQIRIDMRTTGSSRRWRSNVQSISFVTPAQRLQTYFQHFTRLLVWFAFARAAV